MPIQIDRMDTAIELTAPTTAAAASPERRAAPASEAVAEAAVADLVGRVMATELERFLRGRGM